MFDWLGNLFQSILESLMWKSILLRFPWIDLVAYVFIFMGILVGMRKGLIRTLGLILEVGVWIVIVLEFHASAESMVNLFTPYSMRQWAGFIAFVILFVIVGVLVVAVADAVQKIFHTTLKGSIKTIGGGLAGGFCGLLFWSFLSQGFMTMPVKPIQKKYYSSSTYMGTAVRFLASDLHASIHPFIPFSRPLRPVVPRV